jgi:hypothetical protein
MAQFVKKKMKNTFTITVKVKVKLSHVLSEHHAMKVYWGIGGIASSILDLSTRWS